jgi:hypothetical protein
MIDLDAAGHLNEAPWDVAGQLGTYERVYQMRDVDHAVTGHIGSSRVTLLGRLRDPLALGGPNVEAEIDGR